MALRSWRLRAGLVALVATLMGALVAAPALAVDPPDTTATATVTGPATVTAAQGRTTNFDLSMTGGGTLPCDLTPGDAWAAVDSRFGVSQGQVTQDQLAQVDFAPDASCNTTWDGAPAPAIIHATFSPPCDAPVGTYANVPIVGTVSGPPMQPIVTPSITFVVQDANCAPVAGNDAYTTDQGTTLTVDAPGVLANDTDADADELAAIQQSSASNGTAVMDGSGSFTYTPDAGFVGTDSFTYWATDGLAHSDLATVTITVNPVDQPPVAQDDSFATGQDTPLMVAAPGVLANDSDPDGDALTAVLATGPADGSVTLGPDGSFLYIPVSGFSGTDGFTYRANDGTLDSSLATVTITVNAVNHPPVAVDGSVTTNEDTAAPVSLSASDPDGDPLTYAVLTGPSHGTLSGTAPDLTYTPAPNYNGPDAFTFTANDGSMDSNVATVSITVVAVPDYKVSVFVPPIANKPYVNLAVAGRTLPFVFRVTDDSGKRVTTLTGADVSVDASFGVCGTGPTVPVRLYGGSGLVLLPGGWYLDSFKTQTSWAGQCATITVSTSNGGSRSANFRFT